MPSAAAAAAGTKPQSRWSVFLLGFLGAALAVALGFGAFALIVPHGTSVQVGGEGGQTITVDGEDVTLSEVVAQKVLPSVVNIDVYSEQPYGSFPFGGAAQGDSSTTATSLGSGVILSKDGYILTNYHVIEGGSRFVVVANAEEHEATVVGTDPSSDLAVIKIEAPNLTPIELGSSSDLVIGEWVMAVGSPFGLEQSVSTGIVSATSRSTTMQSETGSTSTVYTNMIQTDAAINPGNSGGALVNAEGKLIGINTLIASDSGSSAGVGFAIPVDYAVDIAQQIIDGKTPSHAQLGITMATVTPQIARSYNLPVDSGVYVNSVVAGSAAASAGIESGDIITAFDGSEIADANELMMAVRSHKTGDSVKITYLRDDKENTVDVTLGSDA